MSKVNTLFIGFGVHKETTDMAWVSDKPAYEAGPGKHGHVVKPHAALFERVQGQPSTWFAKVRCCLCMLCFWRPIIIYPFFIKINFVL